MAHFYGHLWLSTLSVSPLGNLDETSIERGGIIAVGSYQFYGVGKLGLECSAVQHRTVIPIFEVGEWSEPEQVVFWS